MKNEIIVNKFQNLLTDIQTEFGYDKNTIEKNLQNMFRHKIDRAFIKYALLMLLLVSSIVATIFSSLYMYNNTVFSEHIVLFVLTMILFVGICITIVICIFGISNTFIQEHIVKLVKCKSRLKEDIHIFAKYSIIDTNDDYDTIDLQHYLNMLKRSVDNLYDFLLLLEFNSNKHYENNYKIIRLKNKIDELNEIYSILYDKFIIYSTIVPDEYNPTMKELVIYFYDTFYKKIEHKTIYPNNYGYDNYKELLEYLEEMAPLVIADDDFSIDEILVKSMLNLDKFN